MKRAAQALPFVVLAATASAQTNTVVGSDPNVSGTTTITYSVCPTAATLTTTLSSTLTLCPGPYCNGGSPSVTLAPGQGGYIGGGYTTVGPNGESTVYETIFQQTCSTGLHDVTYTIMEPCPCTESRPADYIPSGFNTTVATILTKTCDACAESETTVTLTTPCSTGPYATASVTNTGGPMGTAATGGYGSASTGAAATGGAAPAASGASAGGASAVGTGMAGSNYTFSPPITPVGGNVASDVGQNPSTFTGAAQKTYIVGFAAFAVFAGAGAAAMWL